MRTWSSSAWGAGPRASRRSRRRRSSSSGARPQAMPLSPALRTSVVRAGSLPGASSKPDPASRPHRRGILGRPCARSTPPDASIEGLVPPIGRIGLCPPAAHRKGGGAPSSRAFAEFSWRWGESNPRPRATFQGFSGRSRWGDLASRLPPAEDLSASPGSMSGGGPRAEPLP